MLEYYAIEYRFYGVKKEIYYYWFDVEEIKHIAAIFWRIASTLNHFEWLWNHRVYKRKTYSKIACHFKFKSIEEKMTKIKCEWGLRK